MSIPKIIHYCWLSGDPYPEYIQHCIASWEKYLPDYEFILWDLNRFDLKISPWVEQAVHAKKYAFAADYIRLYAVYNLGGIYLDSDVEIIQSFNDLLELPYFWGKEHTPDLIDASHVIEAATFGAEPHNPLIKKCLQYYEGKKFEIAQNIYDTTVLPYILYRQITQNTTISIIHSIKSFDRQAKEIQVFDMDFFSPKNNRTLRINVTPNTHSIHHFSGSWYSIAQKKHVEARIKLCHIFGERIGEVFSSVYALYINYKYTGLKKTYLRFKQKIISLVLVIKWQFLK